MNFETEAKRIWQSMTLWFNAALTTVVPLLPVLMEQLPTLKAYMPDNMYKWAFIIAVVGNALLRFKTNSPVRL